MAFVDTPVSTETWSLERFLTYRIARLNAVLNAQATRLLAEGHGLSLGQWRIVVTIGKGGARTSRQLLEMTQMDPALISRLLRQLEDRKLLKTGRSQTDRRVLDVTLTTTGQTVLDETFPVMQARQRALASELQASDLERLEAIIDRLFAAAQKDLG